MICLTGYDVVKYRENMLCTFKVRMGIVSTFYIFSYKYANRYSNIQLSCLYTYIIGNTILLLAQLPFNVLLLMIIFSHRNIANMCFYDP